MSLGLLGKKLGMTRVYDDQGKAVPVTVVDVSGNQILQRKTSEKNGYSAVQVGFDDQKELRLNKPAKGHVAAHGGTPKKLVREFRFENDDTLPGDEVKDLGPTSV